MDRSDEVLEICNQFVKEAVGRKYNMGMDFFRNRQTIALPIRPDMTTDFDQGADDQLSRSEENETVQSLIEDGRAFFCSELVMKAYKVCGILQQTNDSCSNWLPGDLASDKNKINLVDNVSLGPEQLIITNTMYKDTQTQLKSESEVALAATK